MALNNNGTDNKINLCPELNPDIDNRVNIQIAGNNNTIEFLGEIIGRGKINITIAASHCSVKLGKGVKVNRGLEIVVLPAGGGSPSGNCHVSVGEGTNFNGVVSMILMEKHNCIEMGANCLLGGGITLNTSDGHPVYDLDSKNRLNPSADITIGDSVWVGNNAHFLKKAFVANGSVVAAHAVITKKFSQANVALAGNPSKIIKKNIFWEKNVKD